MPLFRRGSRILARALVVILCLASVSCATPTRIESRRPESSQAVPPATATLTASGKTGAHHLELRVAAVGDIMLGGTAAPEMEKYGYDYPFVQVKTLLQQAQVVFGNLEGPLTNDGTAEQSKKYVFRSPPEKVAPALARAGFNVVSLANNHSLDYGPQGLEDTRAALERAGIQAVGAGRNESEARQPVYIKAGGVTVAFLAYSLVFPEEFWAGPDKPGTAFGHEQNVRADVAAARQRADIVIVSFHWGREGMTELRDYQTLLAHAAIDAGATAVLGHHPHIVQGVERYRNGVIVYSLGNFAFGSYSNTATRSVIALLTFRDTQLSELRLIPINVNNVEVVFQPKRLFGRDAAEAVAQVQQLSRAQGTVMENRDGSAVLIINDK